MNYYKAWIFTCIFCVLCMVTIGGFTRLTNSGLSITEWKPITGILPPISQKAWLTEIEKYKNTPEFKKYNFNITLSEFQKIYFIEYFHRLFARLTGMVFIIPFLYFLLKKKLRTNSAVRLFLVLFFGILQGFMGWYMVKSGLSLNPHVSHYRLAVHLMLACIIFCLLWYEISPVITLEKNHKIIITPVLLFLIAIQMILGAFVAGLKAGFIYNTFPLMDGKLFPSELLLKDFGWSSLLENHALVQFLHRWVGIFLLLFVLCTTIYYYITRSKLKYFFTVFSVLVFTQVFFGAVVLVYQVPLDIALIHQVLAFIIIGFVVTLLRTQILQLK